MGNIASGFCECGCGEIVTNVYRGRLRRFLYHHEQRGRKWTEAQKQKLRGRFFSSERRAHLSAVLKAKGMTRSPEVRAKIAATRRTRGIKPTRQALLKAWAAPRNSLAGVEHPHWRGGHYVSKGRHYTLVGPGKYVPTANLVMEQLLGRPLVPPELVHHIDENPANDDPSNLMLLPDKKAHMRLHGAIRLWLREAS